MSAKVAMLMGSDSDLPRLEPGLQKLHELGRRPVRGQDARFVLDPELRELRQARLEARQVRIGPHQHGDFRVHAPAPAGTAPVIFSHTSR